MTAGANTTQDLYPGDAGVKPIPLVPFAALPTSPRALEQALSTNRWELSYLPPSSSFPLSASLIGNVVTIYENQVVPPADQAALIEMLATPPGWLDEGWVADRVGRTGVALSLTSRQGDRVVQDVLIFDPRTGTFLGHEKVFRNRLGPGPLDAALHVHMPAVVAYQAFLVSGHTASTTATPVAHEGGVGQGSSRLRQSG